jgi:hypothetical protein
MRGHIGAPAAVHEEEDTVYDLSRSLSGRQSRYGRFGEETDLFPLSGVEP